MAPFGRFAELRSWNSTLSDEEIEINSKTLLSGNEPGLLAWYPLDGDAKNRVGDRHHGLVNDFDGGEIEDPMQWKAWAAPIGNPGHPVMRFDGANDYLKLPDAFKLPDIGMVEFWFKCAPRAAQGQESQQQNLFVAESGGFRLFLENVIEGIPRDPSTLTLQQRLTMELSSGKTSVKIPLDGAWRHVAVVWNFTSAPAAIIYVQGLVWAGGVLDQRLGRPSNLASLTFAKDGAGGAFFNGWMSELRIWDVNGISSEDISQRISANMRRRLDGDETGLLGYWPLTKLTGTGTPREREAANLKDVVRPAIAVEATLVTDNTLPMAGDALVTSEYVTYGIDAATRAKNAMMRRFLATPSGGGVSLLTQKRVEDLELLWIGNAQFKPTLLGYIEGAPPVPSENLTVDPPSYNGGSAVELAIDEEVKFAWNREQQAGLGLDLSAFLGAAAETLVGAFKAGLHVEAEFSYNFLNSTTVSASSTVSMRDRLELRGSPEDEPQFPHLGRRFVPKNIGYAVVVSGLADVYITRLTRSGRMVSYHLQPTPDIPIDVNTITFLMNPAYTMNGSLDGLVGSSAADQRFFKHVPEMRAQYGAVYPASYYRLYDAYDRKNAIEKADQDRATYFANFNSLLVDETSLDRNIEVSESDEGQKEQAEAAVERGGASREQYEREIHKSRSMANWQQRMKDLLVKAGKRNIVNTYVWDADGGSHVESEQFAATIEHTIGSSVEFSGGIGFEGEKQGVLVRGELTALATWNLTQTMTKTTESSKAVSLNVELTEVERIGITDHKDRPYLPGEKVDRYRFMSFFLEGATDHFEDFFNEVVDPEWLASNDEEARALREVDRSKPNKTWRILHRVTYVERPALMGFGRDVRTLASGPGFFTEFGPLQEAVVALQHDNVELRGMLDQILEALQPQGRGAPRGVVSRKRPGGDAGA
jgi:hypothetical protein